MKAWSLLFSEHERERKCERFPGNRIWREFFEIGWEVLCICFGAFFLP
jgi:hypothetical protein